MKLINYIQGSLFRIVFLFTILIFHPIQWLTYNLLGARAQEKLIYALNAILTYSIQFFGNKIQFTNEYELPVDRPLIFMANHQSMWDIVGIYWFLRAYRPVFVSKVELKKGIPSISYNLRKSGAAFVDLEDKKETIRDILKLSQKIADENRAAVIFPEGRRSRDGVLKEFAYGGVTALLKKAPKALIVPITVQGTGAITARKYKIHTGKQVSWTVMEPFEIGDLAIPEITEKARAAIAVELGQQP